MYGVYVLQLIQYRRASSTYDQFFDSKQSTDKQVDVTGVSTVSFTGSFLQILRSMQQSFTSLPINLPLGQMLSGVFHTNR
jgi:hypothetical protein